MAEVIQAPHPQTTSTAQLVIGTRGSALALWQARAVRDLLIARFPDLGLELTVIRPEGDIDKHSSLLKIGGRGVFASALQQALLDRSIDIAVHSTKDVPTIEPAGLSIAAFPGREDARDAVVSRHGVGLAGLPASPVIGTSSRRRAVQVQALRPDATVIDIRGNIDTRLRKAETGEYDAVILAAAGLVRMGWHDRITEYLPFDRFVPSPGQGALALETRAAPDPAHAIALSLDQPDVSRAVRLERAFLRAMGGGCTTPLGAHAIVDGDSVTFQAMIASEDGSRATTRREAIPIAIAEETVPALASQMMLELGLRWHGATTLRSTPEDPYPLAGRQVLVTGTGQFAGRLATEFVAERADVLEAPTLEIQPASNPKALAATLQDAAGGMYDWLVVTSRYTIPALVAYGVERLACRLKVAAVGKSTAASLRSAGLPVDLVPREQTGAGLAQAFAGVELIGTRVLCLLGNRASDAVTTALADLGATVNRVESYRSQMSLGNESEVRAAVRGGRVDVVVFSSPSSVATVTTGLGVDLAALSGACLVAIGPTTERAMDRAGLPVHVVAGQPTPEGIVAACRTHFNDRSGIEDHTR